jgi:hypothetical protein
MTCKPVVRRRHCPHCRIDAWTVLGPDGAIWLCTYNFTKAIRYAHERACATQQPGTGDQVQQSESRST